MLNPFPDLLVYSLLAPFILRVVAALIFINLGLLAFRGEKESWITSFKTLNISRPEQTIKVVGAIEIIGGLMLFFGFYTQVAALVLSLLLFAESYVEYKDPDILKRNLVFYILVLAITLSLLLSGAGAFAIDLPL